MKDKTKKQDKFADALGANRVDPLQIEKPQGPLGLLALREEVRNRLRSTGGRPTDPAWKERRCVPFKPEIWDKLMTLAGKMSTDERKVTPAQVVAILIEREVENILVE